MLTLIAHKFLAMIDFLEFQARQQLERTQIALIFCGYFGFFAHLGWYFYWHDLFPLHTLVYENLTLRILGAIFSLLIVLIAKKKLDLKYYGLFYTLLLAYNLPFIETFLWLAKAHHDPSLLVYELTILPTIVIFSVLTSLRLFFLFSLLSFICAIGLYILLIPHPIFPKHLFAIFDVSLYVLFLCILFAYNNQKYYTSLVTELRKKSDKVFHEVNNLFFGIVMKTDILKANIANISDAQQKELVFDDLDKIKHQSMAAAKLLNVLSGNLEENKQKFAKQYEVISILEVIQQAIDLCAWSNSDMKKLITIHPEHPFRIHAPVMLVVHVLINLLRNAFREIEQHHRGCINISFTQEGAFNVLIVQDTVGSLDKKYTSLIFQRGFSTYENGFGFGLAFCVEIMNNIHGNIECLVDNTGTSFRLYFLDANEQSRRLRILSPRI